MSLSVVFLPHHIICHDHHHIFVHSLILCCFYLINSRLWYEGALKYLGENVTGSEIRMWNWQDGSCIADSSCQKWQVGVPMDPQVGRHDFTTHAQGFSNQKGEQTIVTSFNDITVIPLMHRAGSIKGECAQALQLSSGFLAAVHLVTPCEKPWTLSIGYYGASLTVRLQLYREVFFLFSQSA